MNKKTHPKEERTFLMVKPDGVQKGLIGEIIGRLEQRDLKIVALEMFQPTKDQVNEHYPKSDAWITRVGQKTIATYEQYGFDISDDFGTSDAFKIGTIVRSWLMVSMTAAPMVRMVVQGVHAIDMVRKIVGPTMPYQASIGTIRGDYSIDSAILANKEGRSVNNLVHASETAEEAEHEIEFWFGKSPIFSYGRFGVDKN